MGRKLWCIERLEAKDPSVAIGGDMPLMLAIARQSTPPTTPGGFWGDGSKVRDIGHIDAWICAACGYTELWSNGYQQLVHNPRKGVHFVDATQQSGAR
jgi:hypothetical protein